MGMSGNQNIDWPDKIRHHIQPAMVKSRPTNLPNLFMRERSRVTPTSALAAPTTSACDKLLRSSSTNLPGSRPHGFWTYDNYKHSM